MGRVTPNESRAVEQEKYRQRRQSMNPFHPRSICAAPLTVTEQAGSIIVLMDDWAFTGRPWDFHGGQEGRRLKGKQGQFVDVCFYWALRYSVWLPRAYTCVHICLFVSVCVTGWR